MWALKILTTLGVLATQARAYWVEIPPAYHNGSVSIENLSVAGNLDGAKMTTSANHSSFDFWYFDVFAPATSAAINVVFFNTGDFAANANPLSVQISGTFEDGTEFFGQTFASDGVFIMNDDENGITGDWKGSGASFKGSSLDEANVTYEIQFESPSIGVQGTLTFNSRAPAHYPCDPNVPNVDTLLLPYIHWANAVPDAETTVNLNINGTEFAFDGGIGYHDKNWGDKSVITSPKYWDWGHARVGPYSIVWYDLLDYNNTEHVYAYIAESDDIISVGCSSESVYVRQWGSNATYPPSFGIPTAEGLTARYDLGNGQVFVANLTKEHIVLDQGVYARALGSVSGGIEGEETHSGYGFYEEFVYGILFD